MINKISLCLLLSILIYNQVSSQSELRMMNPLEIVNYDFSKDSLDNSTIKKILRKKEFWEPRVSKSGSFLNSKIYNQEIQKYKNSKEAALQSNQEWKPLGPAPKKSDNNIMGNGRINCIRFHNSNSNQIWVGSATSGLWVSNNKGDYWEQVNLGDYPILGISDIAFPVSNNNYIYVATGDTDGEGGFGAFSIGIMLSKDKGNTWEFLYQTSKNENQLLISRLIVNPENENEIFAATNKGLMYFNNGKMKLIDSTASYRDLEMKPNQFSTLYANIITKNNSFISKSTDKGLTWRNIDTLGGIARAQIATTFANPDKVVVMASDNVARILSKIEYSNNQGETWDTFSNSYNSFDGQCFYNMALAISPYFENQILYGTIYNSIYNKDSLRFDYVNTHHPDIHDIVFSPHNNEIYFATDGGIERTILGKDTSINISNNLNITQFYGMKAPKDNENIIYAGSQDNGGLVWMNNKWNGINGGDVLDYQIDNLDTRKFYTFSINHSLYSNNTLIYYKPFMAGQRVIFPNLMINDTVLYFGLNRIIKTLNRGKTLINVTDSIETIVSFDIDEKDTNNLIIACKTASNGSKIYSSKNHGKTLYVVYENSNHIPNSIKFIDSKNNIFLATFGFSDSSAKVLEFQNNIITDVTNNLPNVSINCIELDTNSKNIYLGSDIGIFKADYSKSNKYDWQLINGNMPNLIVKELELHKGSGKLRAVTYGMGIWETSLYNCNIEKPVLNIEDSISICINETLELQIKNFNKDYIYKWNDGNIGNTNLIMNQLDFNLYTYYFYKEYYVTAFSKENECISSSKILKVKFLKPSEAYLYTNWPNVYCKDKKKIISLYMTLTNNYTTNCSYIWQDGSNSNTFEAKEPGIYKVQIICQPNNCPKTYSILIPEDTIPLPIIEFKDNKLFVKPPTVICNWYYNGVHQKSLKDTLDFLGNGVYHAYAQDSNYCMRLSNELTLNINLDEIFIKPNEVDNILKVQKYFDEKTDFSVNISDVSGKEVNYGNFSSIGLFETAINVSNLTRGRYYVLLKNNSIFFQNSFIKK